MPLLKYVPHVNQSLAQPVAQAPQAHAPQLRSDAARLGRSVDDFLKTAGPIVANEYRRQETAKVDDLLLAAGGKFQQWQAEYEQANRGANGVEAARDYARAWGEISKEAVENYKGPGYAVFGDMLKQRLAEKGQAVARQGLAFAERQRGLWEASQWESQQDEFYRMVAANPDDAATIIREREALKGSYAAKHPGEDNRAAFNKIDERAALASAEAMLAKGDTAGLRRMLEGPLASGPGPKLGSFIAKEESGAEGVAMTGYLSTDGTNYGTWSLASRTGSYQGWLKSLEDPRIQEKYGAEACREIAATLKAAGPANTGTGSGRHPAAYKALAKKYPELMEETQREYLKTTHYDVAHGKLAPGLRAMIDKDAALQEMLFSFAVQMGPGGAPKILNGVYHDGIGREELVRAAYARRGDPANFKSSSRQVQQSIKERCAREGEELLTKFNGARPALSPGHAQALLLKADALDEARRRERQAEMANGIKQFTAASEDGHVLDVPYEKERVLEAWGPEQGEIVWRELTETRQLAMDMSAMKTMGPAAMMEFVETKAPSPQGPDGMPNGNYAEEARRQEKLARLAAGLQKRMAEDGAAYVQETYGPAAQARERLLKEGISPATAGAYASVMEGALAARGLEGNIFSKADAQALGAQVMGAPDPVAAARNISQAFGARAPKVWHELAGSLSPAMRLIASGMKPEAGRLLLAAERTKDFTKATYDDPQFDRKDFQERVGKACEDLNKTFLGGGDGEAARTMRSAVEKLAVQYMNKLALKPKEAVARAFDDVAGERYEVVRRGGFLARAAPPCRIPKSLPVDDIKRGMEAVLANPPMDIIAAELMPGADEGISREAIAQGIAQSGHWITDGDEGGLVLFLGTQAVWTRDGRPFRLTWEELARAGVNKYKRDQYEGEMAANGGNFPPA